MTSVSAPRTPSPRPAPGRPTGTIATLATALAALAALAVVAHMPAHGVARAATPIATPAGPVVPAATFDGVDISVPPAADVLHKSAPPDTEPAPTF